MKPRKDRAGWPWIFRYYDDEIQTDGSVKVLRRYREVIPILRKVFWGFRRS